MEEEWIWQKGKVEGLGETGEGEILVSMCWMQEEENKKERKKL